MRKRLILLACLSLSFYGLKAQTLKYLNVGKFPIRDVNTYPPCYFSIVEDEIAQKITEIFSLDSALVEQIVVLKDSRGRELKRSIKTFHENGLLKSYSIEDFKLKSKYLEDYYFTGQLKSKEEYKKEKLLSGLYYDESGSGKEKEIKGYPEPYNGLNGWSQFLADNLRYPVEARINGIEGVVYLIFEITVEGEIENLEVLNPEPHPMLAEEALRVLYNYPYRWVPGTLDGELVKVQVRLPIRFRM